MTPQFLRGPRRRSKRVDTAAVEREFARFADASSGKIGDEGVVALCEALGVDPQDPVTLALSFQMQAKEMCVYTKEEFVQGFTTLGCVVPTAGGLSRAPPHRAARRRRQRLLGRGAQGQAASAARDALQRAHLQGGCRERAARLKHAAHTSRVVSQDVYAFTFPFSLEPGHKNLPREAAIALWQLLLPPHFPLLSDWCRFMEERGPKLVTRDTWTLLLQFARQIKPDLSNYDEDGVSRAAPVSARLPLASLT